jgi:hypothetical protein
LAVGLLGKVEGVRRRRHEEGNHHQLVQRQLAQRAAIIQ